nr:primosomal replication protein PriC [uncultured Haemophilus sp.]
MRAFIQKIEQTLAEFTPFEGEQAVILGHFFTKNEEKIAFFIEEIRQTALLLQQQTQVEYAEIYAKKLLDQIDALQKAVNKLKKTKNVEKFYSSYSFANNVHSLPPKKRLPEYRKALRAFNEKISWLLDKQYQAKNETEAIYYQKLVEETEFRKMRCLKAIEDLIEEEK